MLQSLNSEQTVICEAPLHFFVSNSIVLYSSTRYCVSHPASQSLGYFSKMRLGVNGSIRFGLTVADDQHPWRKIKQRFDKITKGRTTRNESAHTVPFTAFATCGRNHFEALGGPQRGSTLLITVRQKMLMMHFNFAVFPAVYSYILSIKHIWLVVKPTNSQEDLKQSKRCCYLLMRTHLLFISFN